MWLKIISFVAVLIIAFIGVLYSFGLVYFPSDILNLFPLYNNGYKNVPHNSLVSDPLMQFEPWRILAKKQLLSGEFPLWNPHNSGGVPLFANAQSAVLFPLNILYYTLPVSIALNLIAILKVVMLFVFSFLFLSALKLKKHSIILGSTIITFSAFPLVWNLWPHSSVYLFLPAFLYLIEKIKTTRKWLFLWNTLTALTACIAILAGHYETLLHVIILVFIYSIYRLRSWKRFIGTSLFLFIGVLLASVQVLPFLEYFLNSAVIAERVHSSGLYLPLESFILSIIPFILGAPHIEYYKSISPLTNFQESIGGYTSQGVFFVALLGSILLFKKVSGVAFWTLNAIFFAMLSYKIWPVGLLLELPLVSQAQNSRFSVLSAFSIAMVFVYLINHINALPRFFHHSPNKIITSILACSLLAVFLIYNSSILLNVPDHPFIEILLDHLVYMVLTTAFIFALVVFALRKAFNGITISLLLLAILAQSAFLLLHYIPLTSVNDYYPKNQIINKLMSLPEGPILEIGNPSIAPNINLAYNLDHEQNYDAIEIRGYSNAFRKHFKDLNHWGKVENVEIESLRKFGIKYLISDYNLNYVTQHLQSEKDTLVGPLKGQVLEMEFYPRYQSLKGIRILPANYNRRNDCTLNFEIVDINLSETVFKTEEQCFAFLDKMYKTIDFPEARLDVSKIYALRIYSKNTSERNAIGLWGDGQLPYASLLFDEGNDEYGLVLDTDNAKLLEVPNSFREEYNGEYDLLFESGTKYIYKTSSDRESSFILKKANYPGWNVTIDSKLVALDQESPFMKFNVPSGEHIVIIEYVPTTFMVGVFMSSVVFFSLLIYFARNISKTTFKKRFQRAIRDLRKAATNLSSDRVFKSVIIVISSQLVFLFTLNLLSINLSKPEFYTVINWFSVQNASIYNDYLKILLYFLSVPLSIGIGTFYLLWKKYKKQNS